MNEPLVSVVVLNYNGLNDLKECLDSLYNLIYKNIELILVDNNSQDESVEFVKKNYNKVKIIQLDKNYGFAQGNNLGIAHTSGKYIVLLNMDTIVDRNWLFELVKVAEQSKNIGIVGSKIYYYYNRKIIDFAGSSCNKYGNARHIGIMSEDNKLLNTQMKTFYVCGASLLFKRELYNRIKLFDPTYFAYFEDVDLCWRAWISGYDVIYAPKSFLYHKIAGVISNLWRRVYLTERNKLRTLLKNYEIKSLVKILPRYFYQTLLRIIKKFKFKSQGYKVAAVFLIIYLKVILWNLFNIRSLIENRKNVQVYRNRNDDFIFQLMNELLKFRVKIARRTA